MDEQEQQTPRNFNKMALVAFGFTLVTVVATLFAYFNFIPDYVENILGAVYISYALSILTGLILGIKSRNKIKVSAESGILFSYVSIIVNSFFIISILYFFYLVININ